jgi:hypothetical protein
MVIASSKLNAHLRYLPSITGFAQMHKKGGLQQVLSNHAEKIRLKLLGRPLKQMKATLFFPSSEREQNKVLESMSPEYKYQDSENTDRQNKDNQDNQISSILDETTVHDLAEKHLLDSENQHSTRAGTPAIKGSVGSRGGVESLEQLNIMLQNTLPEYQYDRAERGRYRYVSLKFEMQVSLLEWMN